MNDRYLTKNAVFGYARVSTMDQNLSLQIHALRQAGCQEIFTDKISGAKAKRPGLADCLKLLNSGDQLVVWRLDRLGRSLLHLVSVVTDLRKRNIGFRSLMDGSINTTTASGELIFNIFASLAQFERQLIRERTRAGLAVAKARGKKDVFGQIRSDWRSLRHAQHIQSNFLPVRCNGPRKGRINYAARCLYRRKSPSKHWELGSLVPGETRLPSS